LPKPAKGAHYPKMIVHRTTNADANVRRASFWLPLALIFVVASWCSPSPARELVDEDLQLDLVSSSAAAPQWPPDLTIDGVWPDTCPPKVVRTSLDGSDIDILLRGSGRQCTKVATPLHLKVNPAREAGLQQLALGVFRVRLHLLQPNGSSLLIGFRLLQSGWDDTLSRPESGFWWSVSTPVQEPSLAGSGLSIEQQGENLAVTLLSYEAGAPVWYFGSTRMPGSIAHVQLLRMVGGDEPFAGPNGDPRAEPGPSLNLQFLGPAQAQAWLVRPRPGADRGLDIQALDLLRLPFETERDGAAWQGQWALVVGEARQARIMELADLVTADAESFRLSDRADGLSLQCRLNDIGGHPTPAFCSLFDGERILADFDRIGLDRLSGLAADGNPARLVRLPD
jgi:hypothetical protein